MPKELKVYRYVLFAILSAMLLAWPVRINVWMTCWIVFESGHFDWTPKGYFEGTLRTILEWELTTAPDRWNLYEPTVLEFRANETGPHMTYANEAVLIRGLVTDTAASQWGSQEWIDNYGDTMVTCTNQSDATRVDAATEHNEYYQFHNQTLGFIDSRIQNREPWLIYGLDQMIIQHKELADDIGVERLKSGDHRSYCRQIGFIYAAGDAGNSGGLHWHNALSSNWLFQHSGRKEVLLGHAFNSPFYFPRTGSKYDSGWLASAPHWIHDALPTKAVILNPGDALWFNPWIWHATKTLPIDPKDMLKGQTARHQRLSIATTCRFNDFVHGVQAMPTLMFFKPSGKHDGGFQIAGLAHDFKNWLMNTIPSWDDPNDCWCSKASGCKLNDH